MKVGLALRLLLLLTVASAEILETSDIASPPPRGLVDNPQPPQKKTKIAKNRAEKPTLAEFFGKMLGKTPQAAEASPPPAPERKLLKPPGGAGGGGGAAGGQNNKISITPPPTPQEVLPPKPIIVAPLIVRQKRKANKVMVVRHGGLYGNMMTPAPYTPGFPLMNMPTSGRRKLTTSMAPMMPPPMYPNPMMMAPMGYPQMTGYPAPDPQSGAPRELFSGQQINFENVSREVPNQSETFKVSSNDNRITVSSEKKKEYQEYMRAVKGEEFRSSLKMLEDMDNLIANIGAEMESMKLGLDKGYNDLGTRLTAIEDQENKRKAASLDSLPVH